MCGIVGAVAERDIVSILVEGLRRLEYRGYDSAGVAVLGSDQKLGLCRTVGKVVELEKKLADKPLSGKLGVAHTRWATHGGVTEANAHPHLSGDRVAVIHNGIIENFQPIKDEMLAKGYEFHSETDTEVAAHLIHDYLKQGLDLVAAVGKAVRTLRRRVCAARHRCRRPRPYCRQPCCKPARHWPWRWRELRRQRRPGIAAGDAAIHLPGAGRSCRDSSRRRAHRRYRWQIGYARGP